NLYDPDVRDWEHHLLDFWPEPGDYVIELRLVGQDLRSSDDILGIESVRLRKRHQRVFDFGYDKNNDWKTNPVLYD
ncbi:MAG: hypothetical protein HN936_11425, partial [Bacteroidetes bacterium]|nr:hypothetical protein [Bacteroidota bacterium]